MGGDTTKHVNYTILGQKAHLLEGGLHIFCISNQICGKHHHPQGGVQKLQRQDFGNFLYHVDHFT